jgi:outer membrane protein assembly factor BamD (BamD/ComL family)
MARTRYRRKDLKRPDEFVSKGTQLLDWMRTHATRVAAIAGALAAVVLVVLGVRGMRVAQLRQANDELGQALAVYRANRFGDAVTQFTELATRWSATPVGNVARIYIGLAATQNSNLDGAVAALQQGLELQGLPSYLRQQVAQDLAAALERKGDIKAAAEQYAAAAAMAGPYRAGALLNAARLREQLGESAQARTLYERFVGEFPDAPEHDFASAKLAALPG